MNEASMTRREMLRSVAAGTAVTALPVPALAQDTTKEIAVALVGGAHIHTPQYVEAMRRTQGIKAKYAWDSDTVRAKRRAGELKCQAVEDLQVIWNDPEIAAVVICSETTQHHDLVLAAARAKKHMFVEKPLGSTAKESFAMATAINSANLLFTTGYFMRTMREHLFLKEQIALGNFGKITRVRGSNCHSGSLGGWFDGEYRWMADPKIAGVGAFGDLGTHSLDILMWLIGDIASVTADIKIVTNHYPNCDESGEALLKFQNGVTGTLAAGWVDVDNPVTLEISGTQGFASIIKGQLFYRSQKVKGANGSKPWNEFPSTPPPPIHQFFDALAGKAHDSLVKPSEAAARVAVMEAAYKGARTQSWVKVTQR